MGRIPAEVFPPGEYLQDEMDTRGWTRLELASRLFALKRLTPIAEVNGVLSGELAITPDLAARLATVLGSDAQTWLNLQASYDLAKDR